MNAIMDFIPRFCPNCGAEVRIRDSYARQDWHAGASHACRDNCGVLFARGDTDAILTAADASNSDMRRYADTEN